MAKRISATAVGVTFGSAALLSSEAFVPLHVPAAATESAATAGLRGRVAGATGGATAAGTSWLAGAAAAAATAGIAAAGLVTAARSERRRPAAGGGAVRLHAEAEASKPFAGGLIGGESAFSSGDYNFDPLNLSEKCEKFLPWFREAELKHGRISMLAWVGLVVPDIVRIPGPESCYTKNIIEAHNACTFQGESSQVADGPLVQVALFCGIIEMFTTFAKAREGLTLENAGDYQLGLSFLPKEEAKAKEMKLKELKNGRLAMIAFGGAITQAALTGNGFPWLYGERSDRGASLASGLHPAGKQFTARSSPTVAMRAEGSGYKMSKSVPFLPVSPALEGYVGEEDGFDPMGFSLAIDIRWLREAELKHGRVAMLATVGWIATDLGMRVPGDAFASVSTIQAHDAMVKFGSMTQMLCWIGYAELFGYLAIIKMMEGETDRVPGDFGLRYLYPKDEQGQYDMQMKELRNGRLAMLAFSGIATAGVLTQKPWPFFATRLEKSCSAAPALGSGAALCGGLQQRVVRGTSVAARALERSASVPFLPKPKNLQGLVGEEQGFDPIGFAEDVDPKWLREAELKHGRVCMVATVGFFAQQYITFPGFEPTPDALQAVYTAPASGMAALLFLSGYIESSSYGGKITMLDMFEGDRVPGDFNFGAGFLKGKSDKEIYDMKLKELNNGRLAMLAFAGMVHHNIVVKGPLFPLFPDNWTGPEPWMATSMVGGINDNALTFFGKV